MATPLHFLIIERLREHWRAHDNKYPQRVLLTPAQHQQMNDWRHMSETGELDKAKHPKAVAGEKFMGVLIEHDERTVGVMIDVNGVEIPLQAPTAAP